MFSQFNEHAVFVPLLTLWLIYFFIFIALLRLCSRLLACCDVSSHNRWHKHWPHVLLSCWCQTVKLHEVQFVEKQCCVWFNDWFCGCISPPLKKDCAFQCWILIFFSILAENSSFLLLSCISLIDLTCILCYFTFNLAFLCSLKSLAVSVCWCSLLFPGFISSMCKIKKAY